MLQELISTGAAMGSSLFNIQQQRDNNRDNANAAQRSREHDTYMSNTAHQREVEDLKAAGLNPILSAGGNGASTPSSPTPTFNAPQLPEINLPQMLIQQAQLDQNQQRINIDKANSASSIAKNLTQEELNRASAILKKKGLIRAELEGAVSEKISEALKYLTRPRIKQNLRRFDDFNQETNDLMRQTKP